MLKIRSIFFFSIIITSVLLSCATTIEIPFALENRRIVLSANVNGTRGRFFWDTGAPLSSVNTRFDNLRLTGSILHTDYDTTERVNVYALNSITIGNVKLNINSHVITVSEGLQQALDKDGLDGVLGADTFEGYWCEVSFSQRKIILHKEKPVYFTKSAPVEIIDNYFCISSVADDIPFYFLVDTGAPAAMLFPESILWQGQPDEYTTVLSNERVKEYHLAKTHSITILDETFTDKFILTNSYISQNRSDVGQYDNIGVLGVDFLKNYDLLFDCTDLDSPKTLMLYYEPCIPPENRNYGLFYSYLDQPPPSGVIGMNINIVKSRVVINEIVKDSFAYNLGLRPDMIVTKIDDRLISDMTFREVYDQSWFFTVKELTIIDDGVERTIKREASVGYGL